RYSLPIVVAVITRSGVDRVARTPAAREEAMNVTCPQCSTIFRVDPAKVPERGVRARCSVCSGLIAVRRPDVALSQPQAAAAVSGAERSATPRISAPSPVTVAPVPAIPADPTPEAPTAPPAPERQAPPVVPPPPPTPA